MLIIKRVRLERLNYGTQHQCFVLQYQGLLCFVVSVFFIVIIINILLFHYAYLAFVFRLIKLVYVYENTLCQLSWF